MSKHDKQHTLVPRLRFPEFRDSEGWGNVRVADAVKTVTPPKKLKTSQYNEAGRYPVIDQSADAICGWTDDEEAVIREPLPMIVFGDHTCVLKKADAPFAQGADGIKILVGRNGFDTDFLYQLLCARPLKSESYKRHFTKLKLVKALKPPSPDEQRKVANCLGSLDDLMAAEERKLAALRDHKKGLMQQLFPREGETRPRFRFPEFQNAGEWDEQRLEQIADVQSGGTPPKGNAAFWNGSIPWVSAKDMKQMVLDGTKDHITDDAVEGGAKLVPAGTVLMLTRGMTLLKDIPICLLARPMSFNQDVRALRPKNGFDGRFLAYMLVGNKQRIRNMVDIAGHGTGRLNTDRMKALELLFPPPVEQQRIADCLSALDALIAAQAEKLDALCPHKRGLMQQLFPSQEDAEA